MMRTGCRISWPYKLQNFNRSSSQMLINNENVDDDDEHKHMIHKLRFSSSFFTPLLYLIRLLSAVVVFSTISPIPDDLDDHHSKANSNSQET